jgi:trk system potassium uptake protein
MNYSQEIKHRYRSILAYSGLILMMNALVLLLPMITFVAAPDEVKLVTGFILPSFLSAGIGYLIWKVFRPRTYATLTVQEGGVIVLISWLCVFGFSSIPFMMINNLTFSQAFFESVSGWTTTGLSVVDVTTAPQCILLFRSIIQLFGGAGVAVIMLASIMGPVGAGYSIAEGRTEQLVPHVKESAKLVVMIYSGYAIAGTVAYILAGMSAFDAVNHSFAAISTGGFSTRFESIGYWDSLSVESVSIVLMILGNLNFLTAYLLFKGKLRSVFRNGEIRVMGILFPLCIALLFFEVTGMLYASLGKAMRVAVFETVTALTTTGFSTVSYTEWNGLGFIVMITLMLVGGGTCSTAGGIKQIRIYLMAKALWWDFRRYFLPRTAVIDRYIWQGENKEYITDTKIKDFSIYIFLYCITFIIGTAILAYHGYSLRDSLFEFASALGTVGISVGVTAPNAAYTVLWTEIIGMFLGRLEFFVIFVSIGKLLSDVQYAFK